MSGGGAAAATSSEIEFKVCIVPLRPGERDTAGPIPHVVRIAPQSGTGKIPADAIIQEACAAANRTDAGHLNKGEVRHIHGRHALHSPENLLLLFLQG